MKLGGGFLVDPVIGDIFTRECFSNEQTEIDRMVREFARETILPVKDRLNELDQDLSRKLLSEAGELGLASIDIPEAYGGMDLDKVTSALVVEALTTCQCASWVVTFSAHVGIGTLPIVYFGTEDQKRKYLPGLASVELLGAYALTEPGAGSDALNIKTTAVLDDDGSHYVLNGVKQFITNGGWADLFIVFARIEDTDFTAFIVEKKTPGIIIGQEEIKMGIKGSSTTNVTFENCRIPTENLLGQRGEGHHIAFNILNIGRFKLGAADLGGCKSCVSLAVEYALERKQFGQPIAYFDSIRSKLAEMTVMTFTLDSVIYRTVGMMDRAISQLDPGTPDYAMNVWNALEAYAIESSISKILGSETLFRVSDHGIQIFGGYGFSEEYPMAGVFRDNRIDRIFEGTNEINRMVIYGYFLKKALMEELPLRDAVRSWCEPFQDTIDPLGWEMTALEATKRIVQKCVDQAILLFGQDLRNEQITGEYLADLLIGYYGATSTLNRVIQHPDFPKDRVLKSVCRLCISYFLKELTGTFHVLVPVLFPGTLWEEHREGFTTLFKHLRIPFNPVEEVRLLSDDLFHCKQYRFE